MDNEYEIDGFDFEEKEQENIPQEEPQETLQEEPQEIPQEEPQEEQQELSVEEPAPQKKESPFADSPYVMAAQPIREEPAPVEPKEKPQRKGGFIAAILVLAAVAICLGTGIIFLKVELDTLRGDMLVELEDMQQQIQDNSFTGNGNSISGSATADGLTPGKVYAQSYKGVVFVSSLIPSNDGTGSHKTASGSGFIISEDGYIVTNYHVVGDASKITVITYDEKQHLANLVGYDEANDVAVLKIEAEGLHKLELGSSDDLIIGDQVVAIGHPLGNADATLTVGYVSAKDQGFSTDGPVINMIQTDAAINLGSSGGPLFNMKGEVVGITSGKYGGATVDSVGFAIPIDDVKMKLQDIVDYGYVTGAYLGVYVLDVNTEVLDAFGFPRGAYVSEVVEGYCAKEAGVQAKDMIVAIGQYKVDGINGLTSALQHFRGGDTTTITVWRAGAELVLNITMDEKPAPDAAG